MTIGFIGLGIMGEPMSKNLLKKRQNDTIIVFDRNELQVDVLKKEGAVAAKSAVEVVEKSDVIFSIIPKSEHVQELCKEIKSSFTKGKIWIDMSTIDPSVSVEVSKEIGSTGAIFLQKLLRSKAL